MCVCTTCRYIALQRACENKDAKAIRYEVDKIRDAGLTKYLQNETREAMYLVELLERMPANKNVLDMGRKLMTEIRRYQNPPPAMHRIMQSALLLLGEDEDTTDVRTSQSHRLVRLVSVCRLSTGHGVAYCTTDPAPSF